MTIQKYTPSENVEFYGDDTGGAGAIAPAALGSPIGASVAAAATVVAPGAGAALTTINVVSLSLGTGIYYQIEVEFCYGATGDVAGNVRLVDNGGGVANIINPMPVQGGGNTVVSRILVPRWLKATGGSTFGVNALAAGAGGSIYIVSLVVTPVA